MSEPNPRPELNLRYKLSEPEFIFEDKCSSETCINPNELTQSITSILKEALSGLKMNPSAEGLLGAARGFEPSGTNIAPEIKRKQFMIYLRESGFITEIARVILTLYEMDELPPNSEAAQVIAHTLGYGITHKLERAAAEAYKGKVERHIAKYRKERDTLRRVMDHFKTTTAPIDWVNPDDVPPLELIEASGEDGDLTTLSVDPPGEMGKVMSPMPPPTGPDSLFDLIQKSELSVS